MATIVKMPKLGLSMQEGTIIKWHKKEGDPVKKDDPLFDLETDKLTNTVNASDEGILRKVLVGDSETVPVLTHVAVIGGADEDISSLIGEEKKPEEVSAPQTEVRDSKPVDASPAAAPVRKGGRIVATPRAKVVAKELGVDLALVTATGPNGRIVEKDVRKFAEENSATDDIKISPLAAKVAADIGLDLKKLKKHGRVFAEDILAYLQGGAPAACEPKEREETVPMSGMRKAISANMLASHMTSPTVTYDVSIDMTNMRAYRKQLKDNDVKVSYTDLLVKFVAKALTEYPLLNCSVEDNNIIYKHYVNMGVAVALDNGLVVPNIPDADKKSLTEISAELKELADAARSGNLPIEKMRGGTFTITNLGMFGIEHFTPIINQPEVAILGVNKTEDKVVVVNGEMVIRPIMTISLTADHRVVDGSVAAQFMQRVKTLLENPALMLA